MKSIKWLAFGCKHAPLTDADAMAWAIERIRELQPDVIVDLGDAFEADSASRWPSEYDFTLDDEYRADNEHRRRIREAAPNAKLVFLPGNHDDNILAIGRIDKRMRARCNWQVRQYDDRDRWLNEELLTHWQIKAKHLYCRQRGVYRLGQVAFAHGYEHGSNSDEFQAILLGDPFGLTVTAHTHRPMPVTQAQRTKDVPLPYWYANVGCLRDLKPSYVARKRTHRWGQALAHGTAQITKSPRMSRQWTATVEIFRMYDAWAGR